MERAKRIQCPAPLHEEAAIPLLTKMLVPAPYQASEKKAKKKAKETISGLRNKGASDMASDDIKTHSFAAEHDEEEEEESNSPPEGGKKKRAASTNLEAEASKNGKVCVADNSAWDIDSSPERRPRDKPLAES